MNKEQLKSVILEQQAIQPTSRDIKRYLSIDIDKLLLTENIVIITGVRRCGKSTLMQHLRNLNKEGNYYLNFDDERLLNFDINNFQLMMEIFMELFGEQKICYFDEIQNVDGWERFARRLYDQGYKIYITGSNAKMLSQEMGTHLTGRHIKLELYPFSFLEFLDYKNLQFDFKRITTPIKVKLTKAANEYITLGGFPQFLKEEMIEYLQSLYENILYRDIIVRYKLPSEKTIKQLAFYFASNISKEFTYNSLRKLLNAGSANTIADYCEYLENCYLFFKVKRFRYALKEQSASPKKIYAIDTAMVNAIGFRHSHDIGRMLENIVFIQLKRQNNEIYYHREKKECDFVVCKNNQITQLIQVCYDLSDTATREREIEGLIDACKTYKVYEGKIISLNESDAIKVSSENQEYKIDIIPVWEWS